MATQNRHIREAQSLRNVRFRIASCQEETDMKRALDGLLAELIRQELPQGRNQHVSKQSEQK